MHAGLGMELARARVRDRFGESRGTERRAGRRKGTTGDLAIPGQFRRAEAVSGRARELVRLASVSGYCRDELVRLIETLW